MDPKEQSTSPLNMVPTPPSQAPAKAAAIKKPSWATGDPFFDTMAGMDTPEYHQYYNQLTATSSATDEHLASSTAQSLSINGSGDQQQLELSGSSSSPSQQQQQGQEQGQESPSEATTGLEHWNRTREEWTKGRWHVVQSANSQNPALNAIHPGNHDAIYDSLVYDRKRLSKPIPLPLVIKVLVSGWKRDGLWQESPAQPQATPGSAPSSTPSVHSGVNAYVPGFSSTNSKPLQRK
ncbi:hypothetical protein K457DRAFT_131746 [Linnemannia elongata AG-77]|uniref:Gag1-like clamp domain-containing protein n=1 Tax=Linnemannia elongata AG-77 TaxID=1314771 RepID=A0A197KJS4_9FUNG|nr:hypothetical protein K457DRAFT_131746 [Linnemannia elongata AG-77]